MDKKKRLEESSSGSDVYGIPKENNKIYR